ncbi:hypothetical protein MLD38_028652 [Melastoma candidum]|uniref:Uncharacterized protein n=1 Tax=Melastoma candidum TaxID=119954 RepID=A0ACB9N1E1_9MYRT|nr:hypothetical protein MLD38_028652 [Melastoma candidum]
MLGSWVCPSSWDKQTPEIVSSSYYVLVLKDWGCRFWMERDAAEVVGSNPSFKVHHAMCKILSKLVDRVSNILPKIEAARPCSSGMHALIMLNKALEKAKIILQDCRESSVLYLALNGDKIVAKCERVRNLLEQSFGQLQSMVPVLLAIEISRLLDDLRSMTFVLESSEEEAGKAIQGLLHQVPCESSKEVSELKSFNFVALKLRICSQKSILIERRSIKKLLDSVGNTEPKRKILKYFLYLLKKYKDSFVAEPLKSCFNKNERLSISNARSDSTYEDAIVIEDGQSRKSESDIDATPPEEFICPLSSKLMYEPVVIASGQTFERMWIQKWLDEGHETCPKTKIKLVHLAMTPNTAMEKLISRWCHEHDVLIPSPSQDVKSLQSQDNSCSSIASLGSSINDLALGIDISSVSIGSLDTGYSSDTSVQKVASESRFRFSNEDTLRILPNLTEMPWKSQCKVIEDVRSGLEGNYLDLHSVSMRKFLKPLIRFLGEAQSQGDVDALKTVSQLLLSYMKRIRYEFMGIHEDDLFILGSAVDSKVGGNILEILEILSSVSDVGLKFSASGSLDVVLKALNSHNRDLQGTSLKILCNLSTSIVICHGLLPCIPRMLKFLKDSALAKFALRVLVNLCSTEEGKVCIAETKGCVAAVAELLESVNEEEQEESMSVLFSLCSQRVEYCQLVLQEGFSVFPALMSISINGSDKGRALAMELSRLLSNIDDDNDYNSLRQAEVDGTGETDSCGNERVPSSQVSHSRGRKIFRFLRR